MSAPGGSPSDGGTARPGEPDAGPPQDARRLYPILMLTAPFTSLLIVALLVTYFSSRFGQLGELGEQERAERELYAIRTAPAGQVTLLLRAADEPPTEWGAGVQWAVRALAEEAGLELPSGDVAADWPSDDRAAVVQLLSRFSEVRGAQDAPLLAPYNRTTGTRAE